MHEEGVCDMRVTDKATDVNSLCLSEATRVSKCIKNENMKMRLDLPMNRN